jgi:hypothetical protein
MDPSRISVPAALLAKDLRRALRLARDLGVLPENFVVEDDYTYTAGEVPAATLEDER